MKIKIAILCVLMLQMRAFGQDLPDASIANGGCPKHLKNCAVIDPGRVIRGGVPNERNLQELKEVLKVKTIINVLGGDTMERNSGGFVVPLFNGPDRLRTIVQEGQAVKALGMLYMWKPMAAYVKGNHATEKEDRLVDEVVAMMADPALQPVYVHCSLGVDRTGLVVALYRVTQGWSAEMAHQEWVASGPRHLNGILTHEMDDYFFKKARRILETQTNAK